jgi:DNA-binding protein H-NS
MRVPTFNGLSIEQLLQARVNLAKAVAAKTKEVRDTLEGLNEYVETRRFRAASNGAKHPPSTRRMKAKIKYRNPATGDKWSGRGMTPRWLVAMEKAGKKRDSFLVK